jgi:CO/xanthine dehydrogenase Mo-binding subunit
MTGDLARVEDPALLCGQGRFLDDLDPLPGTLVAAIVRSPLPHARITGYDASRALAAPGVAAVIGPRDVAAELRPFPLSLRTPMPYFAGATDRVRFVGEPVAVIVAADRYLAEDAAELVDVDYEELPAVTAVEAWANFHGPFSMIPVLAGALGVPAARLRLHVPADIGGSFGIKAGIYPYVALMALASKHAGHPVRWTEDRLEHLVASSAGADRLMRFEAAVTADGAVTALRAGLIDNVGAYLRPPEPSTLYRCFGGQQLYFGLERLMDQVAAATGLNPAAARGRGKSGSTELVRISVDPSGIVSVLLGTVPQGQGHATVACQVVADRLGLAPEQVRPVVEMDTATTPWTITSGSYSSRFAPLLTSALAEAADQIAATIRRAGAVLLGADPDELELPGELSGVLCRCTGYRNILAAVADVARAHPDGLPVPLNASAAPEGRPRRPGAGGG